MKKQNVRTLSFIVSTFTYLLFGAAIFNALESHNEETTRTNLTAQESRFKYDYKINDTDYTELEEIVIKYHAYRTYPQWKFTGALYFSLTVITTIGYGHSTPQTRDGKIFCMIYAIVGIPLCLVMYQSLGERLNYFASFCIQFFKKCFKCRKKEVTQTEMVTTAVMLAVITITGGAAMFKYHENWNYFDSVYYCVITLTTIGFGDYVAMQSDLNDIKYVVFTFTFILLGLTIVASTINLLVLKFLTMNTDDERKENEYNRKANHSANSDFLNVNGDLLCSFEPNDLDDLKTANNFKGCFPIHKAKRSDMQSLFSRKNFSFFSSANKNVNGNREQLSGSKSCCTINSSPSHRSSTRLSKSSKSHYTIRRAPGKISHLLIPQHKDMLRNNSALTLSFSSTLRQQEGNSNHQISQTEYIESPAATAANQSDKNISNFSASTSPFQQLLTNRSNSLTHDIKLFIDEEESQFSQQENSISSINNNNNNNNYKNKFDYITRNPKQLNVKNSPIENDSDSSEMLPMALMSIGYETRVRI